MHSNTDQAISLLAPAKVNLYLHITGKRDDGYHELDSLVSFADFGDQIRIRPANEFSFSIDGPFARSFTADEKNTSIESKNLAVRAAHLIADETGHDLNIELKLTKNIPLASGLGGGSADAAAVIWGLLEFWDIKDNEIKDLNDLLLSLGADVPACYSCRTLQMQGIGENIKAIDTLPDMPALLINPMKRTNTSEVFSLFKSELKPSSPSLSADKDIIEHLKETDNDLTQAAIKLSPEIKSVLDTLERQEDCILARMSGSGASCFGLFSDPYMPIDAATEITREHPEWWVRPVTLNRSSRY